MIPKFGQFIAGTECIPRESGDDPFTLFNVYFPFGYSPRERG